MGNSLGRLFTITNFGESHGRCVGVVIDGCPAGLPLIVEDIQREVDIRKPAGVAATARVEEDQIEVLDVDKRQPGAIQPIHLFFV